MKKLLTILLTAALLLCAGCAGDTGNTPSAETAEKLTVCLDWTPNINHAGLYAAQANGYFAAEGLDVEIVQPGDNYALQLVAAGQAEFGVSYQEEVTFARAQSIPVVSIAAVIQHNTSCFAAPQDKQITGTADFAGRTYGSWGGQVEEALLAYLAENQHFAAPVNIINIGSSDFFAATASGQIDFSWIFYGVTGVEAELRQVALDTIWVKDIDPALDYYTPVLVAEESWLAEHPKTAKKFLAAVSRGYQFCDENPEQAADMLLQAAPELDSELIRAGMHWIAGRYTDDAPLWGWQKEAVWQDFATWLTDRHLLPGDFDAEAAFTNQYLPQQDSAAAAQ